LAVVGARRDVTVHEGLVAIGEVGLTGEVRSAIGLPRRLAEAARLGFTKAVVPAAGELGTVPEGLEVVRVANLHEAVASAERVTKARSADPVPLHRVCAASKSTWFHLSVTSAPLHLRDAPRRHLSATRPGITAAPPQRHAPRRHLSAACY